MLLPMNPMILGSLLIDIGLYVVTNGPNDIRLYVDTNEANDIGMYVD